MRTACTIERIELLINMNIVGRAEVTLIKTTETWGGGGFGVIKNCEN